MKTDCADAGPNDVRTRGATLRALMLATFASCHAGNCRRAVDWMRLTPRGQGTDHEGSPEDWGKQSVPVLEKESIGVGDSVGDERCQHAEVESHQEEIPGREQAGEIKQKRDNKSDKDQEEKQLERKWETPQHKESVRERRCRIDFRRPHRWILDETGGHRSRGGWAGGAIWSVTRYASVCFCCMRRRPSLASGTPVECMVVRFLGRWCSGSWWRGTPTRLASDTVVLRTIALLDRSG
jgi:hypothetical protein